MGNGKVDATGMTTAYDLGPDNYDPTTGVQAGQTTLALVADGLRKQGVKVDVSSLEKLNPQIQDGTKLTAGQMLRLPTSAGENQPLVEASSGSVAPPISRSTVRLADAPLDDPINKNAVLMRLGKGAQAGSTSTSSSATGAKSQVAKAGKADEKQAQRLNQLAADPAEAHAAWKNLNGFERAEVLARMEKRYGKDFAQQFFEIAKTGKFSRDLGTFSSTPSSKFPMITPEQLKAKGYRMMGREATNTFEMELWVHPSGKMVRREVWSHDFGASDKDKAKEPAGATGSTKVPGEVRVDEDPGVRDQQDKAVELLGEAQRALVEARRLMDRQPVKWDEVNAKLMESYQAQGELDSLMGDPDSNQPNAYPPDMSKVYPHFNQEREAAAQEYRRLYQESAEKDPSAIETRRQLEELQKSQDSGN